MKLNIPTGLAVVLSLIAGVLTLLNQISFGLAVPWHQLVTFGLVFLVSIGISPLTHGAFRNALHLSGAASTVITTVVMALTAAVTTLSLTSDVKGIIVGVLTFLAGIGFGPIGGPVVPAVVPVVVPPAV